MKKFKKCALATLAIFMCMIFSPSITLASDTNIKDMGSKTIINKNKTWTVSFKKKVDVNSLSNNVQVKDITANTTFIPTVSKGSNEYSVKVSPHSEGYITGHQYQLILNKDIKSQEGENLPKTVLVTFYIEEGSGTTYNVSASVVVSPFYQC